MELTEDEALELSGILGRGSKLVGDTFWQLDEALIAAGFGDYTDHPAYERGDTASIAGAWGSQ